VPRFSVTRTVDAADLDRLLTPRQDVVAERPASPADGEDAADGDGDGDRDHAHDEGDASPTPATARFVLDQGPLVHYERTVTVSGGSVTEEFDFRLPPGTWPFLLTWPFRRALRHPRTDGRLPWWYPPQRPDARGATVLGLLATLSLIVGYHGTLLTQTMTFAADEFGAGSAAQGDALASVRVGGALAIALGALADRRGRRLVLSLALLVCIGSTVLGALSPNLVVLAATQSVNRGAWAGASLLLAIIASEEMPAGARAYALSLLAMSGALGAGVALWVLPVADLGVSAWRVLYVLPLLFVPVVFRFGGLIPESRRFVRTHRNVPLAGHYARLVLIAGSSFLFNVFGAPQSQFRNEFLRDERGMSAALISLFVIVTSTPASIGLVVGGRLADTRGRRIVGATAVSVGTVLIALSFVVGGPGMWAAALFGGIVMAAVVPAITVYGPELFPTSLRGRTSGIISMTAMVGSIVGLTSAGRLEEALGSFGGALAVLAIGPLLMAVVVLAWFPETARRELEDLNPEDRGPPDRSGKVAAPVGDPDEGPAGVTPVVG
jgi:MFS family permease